eukprot:s4711_g3.t1
MFYHAEKKRWSIFWRVSPTHVSCFVKTSRGPHMAGETWSVWDPKDRAFMKSPQMVCRLLTVEELVALAPDTIIMNHEQLAHCWFEAPGAVGSKRLEGECFKKNGEMKNGRPVYQSYDASMGDMEYHRWDMRYLYYHAEKKYWTLGIDHTDEQRERYLRSAPTDCYSPLVAPWLDDKTTRYRAVVPHQLDAGGYEVSKGSARTKYKKVEDVPEGFVDPDFPPNKESMGPKVSCYCQPNTNGYKAYWARLAEQTATPILFDDAEPADILQGMVGNCWLLAAIACVAESGVAHWDRELAIEEWKVITIDDRVPSMPWERTYIQSLSSKVVDHKIMVPLIEKAFAKLCGSYTKLTNGLVTTAWAHMTGCCDIVQIWGQFSFPMIWVVTAEEGIYVREENKRQSRRVGRLQKGARFQEVERARNCIRFKKIEGSGPDEGFVWRKEDGGERDATENHQKRKKLGCAESEDIAEQILQHLKFIEILDLTSFGTWRSQPGKILDNPRFIDDDPETPAQEIISSGPIDLEEFWQLLLEYDTSNFLMGSQMNKVCDDRLSGIMPGHAYSVLQAKEVEGMRFVQLRNPWGHDEWGGPWSDRSDEWEANPKIQEGLKAHELTFDGKFWMEWEDFAYVFGNLDNAVENKQRGRCTNPRSATLAMLCKCTAWGQVKALDAASLTSKTNGVKNLLKAFSSWEESAEMKTYELFEKALYKTMQKADESTTRYVNRLQVAMDELGKVDVKELHAFWLLRQSALGVEDRKRVLTMTSGTMKTDKIEQAMRTLATSILSSGSEPKKKVYPTNFVEPEIEQDANVAPIYNVVYEEDEIDPETLEQLAQQGDSDALNMVSFEKDLEELFQEVPDLQHALVSYHEADKKKSRGFWPPSKGKGRSSFSKGFRKGSGKGGLLARIARTNCKLFGERGHWKAECPNRGTTNNQDNVNLAMHHEHRFCDTFPGT